MDASKALILAALALLAAGCQDDDDGPSGLPAAVAETRSQILDAAESGDYDQLPRLLNDENLAAWRQRAPNRSRRWRSSSACPIRFGRRTRARSTSGRGTVRVRSGEMLESDRELFRQVMTEAEVEA